MHWYLKAFKNYFVFKGRASRKEFWMFMLISLLMELVILAFSFAIGDKDAIICVVYLIVIFVPTNTVGIRRLHDVNLSGWWLGASYVPGFLLFVFFLIQLPINIILFQILDFAVTAFSIAIFAVAAMPGKIGENKYAPDPKQGQVQLDG